MQSWLSYIPSLISGKSAKLALSALIIDTILALVFALIIDGGKIASGGLTILFSPPYNAIAASGYLVFFFVIWFFLYIQTARDNEDGFSEIRKKLVGDWVISYTTATHTGTAFPTSRFVIGSSVSINPDTRKLEIRFRIKDNPIYADDTHMVNIVALRRDFENTYNLFYYYKGSRKLQPTISSHIESSEPGGRADSMEVEFMAILKFDVSSNNINIQKIEGGWYDLNGNISRVTALLNDLNEAKNNKEPLPVRNLAELGGASCGAYMGDTEFTRGAP